MDWFKPPTARRFAKGSNHGSVSYTHLDVYKRQVYFLVLKPKQGKKVPADLDDFDLEDEVLRRQVKSKLMKLLIACWNQ